MSKRGVTREIVFKAFRKHGPASTKIISEKIGMLPASIEKHIRTLHKEKRIYITEYLIEPSRRHVRVWAVGCAPDAPRLDKGTPSEFVRCRQYFADDDDDAGDDHGHCLKRRRILASLIQPFRDPMLFMTAGVRP
jgi:hypothetical protein